MALDPHPLPSFPPGPEHPGSRTVLRRSAWLAGGLLAALGAGAAVQGVRQQAAADALAARTTERAVRHVLSVPVRAGEPRRSLSLPGTLKGAQEAPVHARVSGYLQRWTRDLGQRVQAGELLAVIDTPESEQELQQARASREQARARAELAASSLRRWEALRARDAVSQQELDERQGAVQQAQADLQAAEANLRRLEELQAYRRVTAPFAGVITRRLVEVGTLVSAGSGPGSRALFELTQTDPLRLEVAVPQAQAGLVRTGQTVRVQLPEIGGPPRSGRIARSAGALDPASRSLRIEVELPNPDGRLLPGAYAELTLPLAAAERGLVVPAGALQFRPEGARVAVLEAQADGSHRVRLQAVQLGRDLGGSVEVREGLNGDEQLVLNPQDAIASGETVRARPAPSAGVPAGSPARPAAPAGPGASQAAGALARADAPGVGR